MTLELKTISNVPIIEVGMNFPVSTGVITVTEEDLLDAVAAQQDTAVKAPRIKLGHGENPMNATLKGGANPAFGTVQNLRYNKEDMTLYGDLANMPAWLADIAPVGYPSRSIEGAQGVETVTGKKWRMIITAVSLLGVEWPGISTLDDLQAAFSTEGPKEVSVKEKIAAALGLRKGDEVEAATNMDDVRRAFVDQVATGDRYWWWIRAVYIDPYEVIVDNDDGELYRMSFSVSDEEVQFGEPQQVKIVYEDVPEKIAASIAIQAMNSAHAGKIAASYGTKAESRPELEEEVNASMDPKKIREGLGLPEDATDDQVKSKIVELELVEASTPAPEVKGEPSTPAEGDPEDKDKQEPIAASTSDTVQVDRETFEQLKRSAELGVTAYQRQEQAERDNLITAAVKEGRIPPARREHYEKLFKADAEGTKELLASLEPGTIPVKEVGEAGGVEVAAGVAADDTSHDSWFPEAKRRREMAAAGQQPTVVQSDKN